MSLSTFADHFVWKDKWAVAMSAPKWVLDTSLSVDPSTQTLVRTRARHVCVKGGGGTLKI